MNKAIEDVMISILEMMEKCNKYFPISSELKDWNDGRMMGLQHALLCAHLVAHRLEYSNDNK